MLAALVVAPTLYAAYDLLVLIYLLLFTSYSSRMRSVIMTLAIIILPLMGYAAMRASEIGMDVLKSLRPLFLAVFPTSRSTEHLRLTRQDITNRLNDLINDLGPQLHGGDRDEFEASRVVRPEEAVYGQILTSNINRSKSVGSDLFRWEEVDPSEATADDVFLFKDQTSGAVGGDRTKFVVGSSPKHSPTDEKRDFL
ncbi:hypothetical protein HDU76_001536 [Blyttiomyces sp. JEL0837]|nr:hypothetical protein HDU76_001536 [Blyttiomyces sp. JEL0837]